MGRNIAAKALIPPEVDTLEKVLPGLDPIYKMNHRGEDAGYYRYTMLDPEAGMNRAEISRATAPSPESIISGRRLIPTPEVSFSIPCRWGFWGNPL